jgi:hypothetical protein
MSAQLRQELVPFADQMIHLFHSSFRAAAERDPVFRRMWDEGVKDRLPRAETWIGQAGPGIAAPPRRDQPGQSSVGRDAPAPLRTRRKR